MQRQMLPDSSSRISVTRRLRVAVEQGVGRHHQPRRAEPALHGAGVDERPLHVGRRARLGEALDRRDRDVDGGRRQHEARAHELAVDEHAARAALALLARPLGAVQAEPLAQHVQQALAEPGVGDRVAGAVDVEVVAARSWRGEGAAQEAPGEDVDGVAAVGRAGPVVVDRAGGRGGELAEAGRPWRRRPCRPSQSTRAGRERLGLAAPARSSGRPSRGRCAPTATARRRRGRPRRWR